MWCNVVVRFPWNSSYANCNTKRWNNLCPKRYCLYRKSWTVSTILTSMSETGIQTTITQLLFLAFQNNILTHMNNRGRVYPDQRNEFRTCSRGIRVARNRVIVSRKLRFCSLRYSTAMLSSFQWQNQTVGLDLHGVLVAAPRWRRRRPPPPRPSQRKYFRHSLSVTNALPKSILWKKVRQKEGFLRKGRDSLQDKRPMINIS